MVIFQLPHRQVLIEADLSTLAPPYEIGLKVELGPAEFFGDAPLSGKLREIPGGAEMQMNVSLFQGIRRPIPVDKTPVKKFDYNGFFDNIPIAFNGSVATLNFNVGSFEILGMFVQEIIERLPSSFAAGSLAPITIISMTGTVNGCQFVVRYDSSYKLTVPGLQILEQHLDQALPSARRIPRQIVAAERYLSQNFLLEYSSEFINQFTGERLLNLCKAFESLIPANVFKGKPEEQDNRIRIFLESWGVHFQYSNVLISLRKLRSALDIAHVYRSPITADGHDSIDEFVPLAERCLQALIQTAVRKFNEDNELYPVEHNEVVDIAALRYIRKYRDLPPPRNGDLTQVPII